MYKQLYYYSKQFKSTIQANDNTKTSTLKEIIRQQRKLHLAVGLKPQQISLHNIIMVLTIIMILS